MSVPDEPPGSKPAGVDSGYATVRLSDGRALAYAEYGDRTGRPVVFCHGLPGSRLTASLAADAAAALGVRLVAPDRPGMGRSTHHRRRTIGSWAADVTALADALELDRFGVLALSGGGPFALACADRLPDRLTGVGLVNCIGPPAAPTTGMVASNRWLFRLARISPLLPRLPYRVMVWALQRDPDIVAKRAEGLPDVDRAVATRPRVSELLRADLLEAFHGGTRGPALEASLIARRWDVDLAAISMPVDLWQGERDVLVSPSMGRYYAEQVPACRATFYPEEGHLSLPVHRAETILETVGAQP